MDGWLKKLNIQHPIIRAPMALADSPARLEPEVRRFYEDAANELGVSLQSIIKISLTGLMKVSHNKPKTQINLMVDRFFEIFAAHNIPLIDIPKYLGSFKVPLSVFSNQDRLLDALNTDLLSYIADLFSVNLKWLQGIESSCISSANRWYKSPGSVCGYLNELSHKNIKSEVLFISDSSYQIMLEDRKNERYDAHRSNVGIVIKIPTQTKEGLPYTKFELWEDGFWGYTKCRMDLKMIMLFCVQNHFDLRGIFLSKQDFKNLFQRKMIPISIEKKFYNFWEPSDYVTAGYTGDKDTDELLEVVDCYHYYKIREYYDEKGRENRSSMWDRFALDLTKYIPGVTSKIEEIFSDATIQYNSVKPI
ncbi:MAG: hypothetical protein KIT56_08260 [Gammaproteobacteria bacterium]|nr:hypothetical protein [Gammaproteobacteria bacterium]MCW5583852.1 hypothetical protein [Gammaproteobacteria bacterium]